MFCCQSVAILTLFAPSSGHEYPDSRHKDDGAENWGHWKGVMFLVRDLQRTHINVLLLVGKSDSAHRESDDSKNDKKNAYNCGGFHRASSFTVKVRY